jgi:hypothetical protein
VCSVLALVAAQAGSSSAGGQAMFSVIDPASDGGPATTVDVVHMGLPGLTNVTGSM